MSTRAATKTRAPASAAGDLWALLLFALGAFFRRRGRGFRCDLGLVIANLLRRRAGLLIAQRAALIQEAQRLRQILRTLEPLGVDQAQVEARKRVLLASEVGEHSLGLGLVSVAAFAV